MLIEFDYYGAMRQAGRVEDAADDIRQLASGELEDILNELSVYWKGQAAELYFSKCRELQRELRDTSRELNCVANNIRFRSERVRAAEEMALQIAQDTGH